MVLGNSLCRGPVRLDKVGPGLIMLAVGANGTCLSSIIPLFFVSLPLGDG